MRAAAPLAFALRSSEADHAAPEGELMFRHVPRDTRRSSCYGAGGSSFCPLEPAAA